MKGLQGRNIHILDGTTVNNKGKLILTETSHRCKNMIFKSTVLIIYFLLEICNIKHIIKNININMRHYFISFESISYSVVALRQRCTGIITF